MNDMELVLELVPLSVICINVLVMWRLKSEQLPVNHNLTV